MAVEHGTDYTPQQVQELTQKERLEQFAKAVEQAVQLINLESPSNYKTYQSFNKDNLRNAMKNPLTDNNQKILRKLSQYLYHLSFPLRRIIAYYASQIDMTAYTANPNISMTEDYDEETLLKNYESVLKQLKRMNLPSSMYDAMVTAWREDCVYLYSYYDEGDEPDVNSFTTIIMDGDYCKISSRNYDGTYNYAFDFSFFNGANSKYLEFWDKEFTTKYNAYDKDSTLRWQELDPNRAVCFKVNSDQPDRVIPPFASLLEDVIDLTDLRSITSTKDELSAYKLLVARIETLSSTKEVNDFSVDLDTCVRFYNKINQLLPPGLGIVLSPMPIDYIDLKTDATDETNRIADSMSNLFANAGTPILDNTIINNNTGIKSALLADTLLAQKSLLPQIEAWVNRMLDVMLPNNGIRIEYMPDVSPYNKSEKIKELKEAATLGIPGAATKYSSLLGISPLDSYSFNVLEHKILKIQENWVPLSTSYTQTNTSDTGGAPAKDDGELSDEGAKSRDKESGAENNGK